MPTDQTRNVSLTAELNGFIRDQVASGQYQNASEVVRAGLRLLVQQAGVAQRSRPIQGEKLPTPRAAARGRHARPV
jgi:putative addiction module CopG family antidote